MTATDEMISVIHAYCRLFDSNRLDEVVTLFTEDCVANYLRGETAEVRGRAALLAFLKSALAPMEATSHHVSNVEIELAGADAARSVTYLRAWHRYRDGRPDFEVMGQYHDLWRRTGEGWRLASRRSKAQGTIGIPSPFEPTGRIT